jgi:hypothetical protein
MISHGRDLEPVLSDVPIACEDEPAAPRDLWNPL